jgi:NADPH-dependent FMN reductase
MNAVILNAAAGSDETAVHLHAVLMDELVGASWQVTTFTLETLRIAFCLGCFECWTKSPGVCRFDDDGRTIARTVINSDVMILFTPVTFGCYCAELKIALDRLICLISPFFIKIRGEVHHRRRYERYPRLVGLGLLPEPDPESERIFTSLVRRNALNLHAPAHLARVLLTSGKPEAHADMIRSLRTTMEGAT